MGRNMNYKTDQPVTRSEALDLLFLNWFFKPRTETISLNKASGRVTANEIASINTMPPFRTSQADGIAVRSADFNRGIPDTSGWVKGVEYEQANTGDDFPDAYDSVIPVESIYYDDQGNLCFIDNFTCKQGDRINKSGCTVREGELLVKAHVRLTPVHLAVLATGGIYQIKVIKKPKVIYIPTGNELVTVGTKPERGQNIESNGLMVSTFLSQWGADPVCFPIIKDNPEDLDKALDMALDSADIVLVNGGSSKGTDDYNATMLQRRASLYRHGIKAIPGKPVAIAIIKGKPVINVPGPTMATFLALDWCVSGLINHYFGTTVPVRSKIKVKLEQPLQKRPDYEQYFRFVLTKKDDFYSAAPMIRFAGVVNTLLNADAVFIAPIGVSNYKAGDEVEAELLHELETL